MNWRDMQEKRGLDILGANISRPNLQRIIACKKCGVKYDLLGWEACPKCARLGKKTKNHGQAQDMSKAQVKEILRARGYIGRQVA